MRSRAKSKTSPERGRPSRAPAPIARIVERALPDIDDDVEDRARGGLQSIGRAFAILEEVARNRDGIGLVQSNRPPGPFGPYITHDNQIHDNTVTLSGGNAYNGMIEWINDGSYYTSRNNLFSHNTYNLICTGASPFIWADPSNPNIGGFLTPTQWRNQNQDPTGIFYTGC